MVSLFANCGIFDIKFPQQLLCCIYKAIVDKSRRFPYIWTIRRERRMARRHPRLEEFLAMPWVSSLYIDYKTIECYMRKGRRRVEDKIVNALTIANIKNRRRVRNTEINPNHTRTGL